MNSINHFLTSFIILFLLFNNKVPIQEIIIFTIIFGVLIDLNQIIAKHLKKPNKHRRTWIEEPFGLIFLGIPIGLILSLINPHYFLITIIPYGSHILLDYFIIHEVSPLAPFSKKNLKVGFFKSFPQASWYTGKEKGTSENYFTIINLIILAIILYFHFP